MDSSVVKRMDQLPGSRESNSALIPRTSIAALRIFEHAVKYALSGAGFLSTPPSLMHGLITTGRLPDDYQSDVQVVALVCSVGQYFASLPHTRRSAGRRQFGSFDERRQGGSVLECAAHMPLCRCVATSARTNSLAPGVVLRPSASGIRRAPALSNSRRVIPPMRPLSSRAI